MVLGGLALTFGPFGWAAFTNPRDDGPAIKAAFKGILGKAGPSATVTSFQRSGTILGGRSTPTYRRYEVTVRRHDGEVVTGKVGVPVGFLTSGEIAPRLHL